MVTMVLARPRERELDWAAAAKEIRAVPLERLWQADDLYPWEAWLQETANLPGAKPAFVALREAQTDLHAETAMLRAVLEADPGRLIRFELPTHIGWVAGGPSAGDSPDDVVGPMIELAEAGILRAAGFTQWTEYVGDLDGRHFEFDSEATRRTRVGIVGAYVAERAASLPRPPIDALVTDRLDVCTRLLRGASDGRSLIEAGAQLLLLITWLLDPTDDGFAERLDLDMLDAVLTWDEDEEEDEIRLIDVPAFHYHREVTTEVLRRLDALNGAFVDIAEWQSRSDCHYDGAVDEELATSLEIEPMAALLGGVADLHGGAAGELLDWPAPPIPASTNTSDVRVARGLLVLGASTVDWDGLQSRLQRQHPQHDRLVADLFELRDVLERRAYRRYSTVADIGDYAVLVAVPDFIAEAPDVAFGIVRLQHAGLLDGESIVWLDLAGYANEDAYRARNRRRILPAVDPDLLPEVPTSGDPWDLDLALLGVSEEERAAEGPLPPQDYRNGYPLECIDGPSGCDGEVELRYPGHGEWRWPRCVVHGERRRKATGGLHAA